MKFLPLIWAGIWRRPGRALLTLVSMVSAFVLFGVLQGFSGGLGQLVSSAHADLLLVQSQVSEIDPLPVASEADLARVPGVSHVAKIVFMGGPFRDPNEFMPAVAVDAGELQALNPPLKITAEQWAALAHTRSGALVSADIAKLYGFRIGDRVPLKPQFVPNRDGTQVWPVDIVGIYPEDPEGSFLGRGVLMNYAYVDSARAAGAGTTHVFVVKIDDPAHAGQVSAAIDALSANSAHATRTFSEKQLALAQVAQIGQVGLAVQLIMGAVFFALLFSVGAVMIQASRERTGEVAVLKTLGFGDVALTAIVLAESLIFCLLAAAVGLGLSTLLYPLVIKAIQFGQLPPGPVMAVGLIVAAALALVTAAIPAWRARQLVIVDALAGR
jgi:putative ABC transport system permease protein